MGLKQYPARMLHSTIAHYKVTAKLGQGGMGVVYQAMDTKLDREVAIKVLPESFAQDKERLARFEREAKMLASLNHPNIASIYGLEDSDGKKALVLELVEGETLTERLRTGAMPIDEALDVCKQIAEALEAAHEKGIIHRDLKPGNIKITPDGKVKVLDFGLAKAAIVDSSVAPSDNSQSPTLTADYTRPGLILGTAAYMSPEQARAKPVDKRSDIWSFGCVLYECLTGKCLFRGEDVTETLATVIKGEPQWTDLPSDTPPHIQWLIRKCLVKDRRQRLHDISDARVDLEKAIADPNWGVESGVQAAAGSKQGISKGLLAVVLVTTALIAISFGWVMKPIPPPMAPPTLNVPVILDQDLQLYTDRGSSLALSKDGQHLVFTTRSTNQVDQNKSQLHLRSLTSGMSQVIQGSDGAYYPFFSPDGDKVGFFSRDGIKIVPLSGGKPRIVVSPQNQQSRGNRVDWGNGAAWSNDGLLVYAPRGGGLLKVPASDGEPTRLTNPAPGEAGHRWPQFLPDDQHVLFTVNVNGVTNPNYIQVVDVQNPGSPETIIKAGSFARYVESGHLIYLNEDGWLHTVRFDTNKLEVVGPSTPLMTVQHTNWDDPQFAVAEEAGTLAYLPGTGEGFGESSTRALEGLWVGEGVDTNHFSIQVSEAFRGTALSQDDQRLAFVDDGDIWIVNLQKRRLPRRLTLDEGDDRFPVWDGDWIVFSSSRSGKEGLWRKRADGSGELNMILEHEGGRLIPQSVSDDGKILLYVQRGKRGNVDVWVKNMDDTSDQGKPLLDSQFDEARPVISPDGRSVAYNMNQGRGSEFYLRKIDGKGFGDPISTVDGGGNRWSADGDKLFYSNERAIWSVDITVKGGAYEIGEPKEAVQMPEGASRNWDVSSDGKRFWFLMGEPGDEDEEQTPDIPTTVNIIFNWFTELNEKVPVRNE